MRSKYFSNETLMLKKVNFLSFAVTLIVSLLFYSGLQAQVPVFSPCRLDYKVGSNPWSIATGDFNNDGKQDVAAANYVDNNVTIRLGNGDGTLGSALSFNVGLNPVGIISGDFNDDNKLDLITSNFGSTDISLLKGNGDGTFSTQVSFSVGNTPRALVSGDFNKDSKPDVAVTNRDDYGISILINNGGGTFNPAVNYYSGGIKPKLIIAEYLNDDQALDLAFVDAETKQQDPDMVGLMLGNGDGTFQAADIQQIDIIGYFQATSSLTSIDFDEDNKKDLIISVHVSGSEDHDYLSLLRGNGDGTFTLAPSLDLGDEGYKSFYLVSTELNDDNHDDLVITGSSASKVAIYFGTGNGTFDLINRYTTAQYPRWLSMTDLNNDSILDIVSCNEGSDSVGNVSLLLGKGNGAFVSVPTVGLQYQQSYSSAVGDLNYDGKPDLAVACWDSTNIADGHLIILFGNGDGSFTFSDSYLTGKSARTIVIKDFDADNDSDIAVVNDRSHNILVFINEGNGLFQDGVDYPVDLNPQTLATGDFNSDNIPDLVCTNYNGNNFSVLLGNGNGTFQSRMDFPTTEGPREIIARDINGDQIEDVIILNSKYENSINKISVHNGNGDGTFNSPQVIDVPGTFAWNMKGGDFDKNGSFDLIVTDIETNKLILFSGNADGTFESGIIIGKIPGPRGVEVSDINNDNNPDIAVTSSVNNDVFLFYGDGAGNFTSAEPAYGCEGAWNIYSADLNGDTKQDFVVTTGIGGENNISLLFNNTIINDVKTHIPSEVPQEYSLQQNYPNPFNPSTTIEYSIPIDGNVTLKIYNVLGEAVYTLVNGYKQAGNYIVDFNAGRLSSGIYYYRLSADSYSSVKKMILLK
jgi:hypothetical protein